MATFGNAVEALSASFDPDRPGEELGRDFRALCHHRDRLNPAVAKFAAAFAASNEFEVQGFTTPVHWLRVNGHMGGGAAADLVAVGELIDELPKSVEAVNEGAIGFAHLAFGAHRHWARGVGRFETSA